MAATAAAAVGSSFSTSIQTLKCVRSKCWPSDPLLRVAPSRPLQGASSSSSSSSVTHPLGIDLTAISAVSQRWPLSRISAAVAQRETTTVTAPVDEEVVEEEEEDVAGNVEVDDGYVTESSDSVNTKLYFGNLPYHCDSAILAGIIQDHGTPELVEVLYDRDSGRSRGFGFVTMSSVEDCITVIENLDGSEYGGRILRVNFSDKPRPKEPLYPETDYKLFVGNLAWSVTSEMLTEAFQEYGNVVGARVLYDGETGKSRGYGFVSYSTGSDMNAALESLNGVELEGRPMRVSRAEGKRR